jgi:hypothetical protein
MDKKGIRDKGGKKLKVRKEQKKGKRGQGMKVEKINRVEFRRLFLLVLR